MTSNLFDLLNLVIGVLCLYWAIVGRGYPYKMNYPKKIAKYARKMMRITLFIAAPACLGMAACSYFGADPETMRMVSPYNIFYWISMGIAVASVALFIISLYGKYGKEIIAYNKSVDKPKNYKN